MSSPILDLFSLKGKNVVITGATGGIGLEVTLALAQAGADIVSIEMPRDPSSAELRRAIEETGRRLNVFECNIKDHQSIKDTFAAIWKSGVVPDILVNCAGITRIMTIEDTSVQDIDDVMAINFRGTYLAIQEFGRELLRLQRPGKIINFASIAAFLAQTEISVYCSSKAAVQNLTRAVSNEWAGKGITCNAICPGFIHTKMCEKLYRDKEFSSKVVARTSMGRWGEPQDLKGLAVFLASPASDFITGSYVTTQGEMKLFGSSVHVTDTKMDASESPAMRMEERLEAKVGAHKKIMALGLIERTLKH